MSFEKLNKLVFTKENPNNSYVSWDIGKPPLNPRYTFEDLTEENYLCIIKAKTRLDEAIYAALLEYVNDEKLCNTTNGMFPRSDRLTGNFYVAEEHYFSGERGVQGHILTHFTEMFSGGVITTPTEQDYLGLEVRFVISTNGDIFIEGIDSSSI